jgi:hypothetical protein
LNCAEKGTPGCVWVCARCGTLEEIAGLLRQIREAITELRMQIREGNRT